MNGMLVRVAHTGCVTNRCKNSYNKTNRDALIFQIYFWNKTLHVSGSISVRPDPASKQSA